MRFRIMMLVSAVWLLVSCGENKKDRTEPGKATERFASNVEDATFEDYTSEKWKFSLKYPKSFEVHEDTLAGEAPVINLYEPQGDQSPPFAIHEDPSFAYIAFLPKGFGVDGPSGKQMSLEEWAGELPLPFTIDKSKSTVYLLENGGAWAFHLRFIVPPESWEEYGGIFVHYQIKDFIAECLDANGEAIPIEECDIGFDNELNYSGNIKEESIQNLNKILLSLNFFNKNRREELSDLIKLKTPKVGQDIDSPLELSGEARGFWFFEGEASYKLYGNKYEKLAEGSIKAVGEWMTEDFVPFTGEAEFSPPESKRAYLILNRANPSGKPEMDRAYVVPLNFSSVD